MIFQRKPEGWSLTLALGFGWYLGLAHIYRKEQTMKRTYGLFGIVLILAIWTAVAIIWVATSAPPAHGTNDLGEPDLLTAACTSLAANAMTQGVTLEHCRQTAPPTSSDYGRTAIVHVSVFVKECPCKRTADVYMTKSLWQNNGFNLTN